MTDDEAEVAYKSLSIATTELGYQWIVAQVEETINFGKITRAKAVDYSSTDDLETTNNEDSTLMVRRYDSAKESGSRANPKKKRKGRSVVIGRVEPYTPLQRLHILLTAIERTFIETSRMESSIVAKLMKIDSDRAKEATVSFDEDESRNLSLNTTSDRTAHANSLRSLIEALRKTAN